MGSKALPIVALADMQDGQEADLFALLSAKQPLTTRDGKPYFRVTFRDARREVSFPIWSDSAWAVDCRDTWSAGEFYKLRAQYRETNYGPQLEIQKIRPVTEADHAAGFDAGMLLPRSRFDPEAMYDELVALAESHIDDSGLRQLVLLILAEHREDLLDLPAATRNHHAFAGGYLEHVRSVTRTCVYLAEKYAAYYSDLDPPLDQGLVVAGAILHDIGKLRELKSRPEGAEYTAAGQLIGHILQGRDIVRETAARVEIDPQRLLRLEHIIVSHQRLPEWGSPKPPMTPEALIVHHADDLDAKLQIMVMALQNDAPDAEFTSRKNPLGQRVYRGASPGD